MATLTLKQVPAELVARLREDAQRQRRSINQHAIRLLELAVDAQRPSFAEAFDQFSRTAGKPPRGSHATFEGLRSRDRGRKVEL